MPGANAALISTKTSIQSSFRLPHASPWPACVPLFEAARGTTVKLGEEGAVGLCAREDGSVQLFPRPYGFLLARADGGPHMGPPWTKEVQVEAPGQGGGSSVTKRVCHITEFSVSLSVRVAPNR